jgi:ketosteroid isomerase-like protein
VRAERGNPVEVRVAPAGVSGKPTVRKAQSPGGTRMTEKRMPAAETQRETGTLMHPRVEMSQPSALPDTDEYHGREELVRGTRLALEAYEGFRFSAEEAVDLGERVFMRVRLTGRGKTSGIDLDQTAYYLWTFRDGMPWRCEVFFDEDAARQAAGLRP